MDARPSGWMEIGEERALIGGREGRPREAIAFDLETQAPEAVVKDRRRRERPHGG